MCSFIEFDEVIAIVVIKYDYTLEVGRTNLIEIYMYSIES